LYLESIQQRDYPVIMATTLIYAVILMLANLLVDLLYGVIDPRVRYS
jgi:peptide/nickel transport system permease protein